MRNLLLAGMILLAVMTGCGEKTAPARRTYLYCRIDTLWQSLPSYQVTSEKLFPYGKLVDDRTYSDAAYRDGVAWIELEIDRPTTLSVMPVRDSTVGISWSGTILLLPGDSLELQSALDTTFPGLKCVRPRVVETARQDNTCDAQMQQVFSPRSRPRLKDNDLTKYKSDLQEFFRGQRAFRDSCRMQTTLSDEYVAYTDMQFDLDLYNSLCTAVRQSEGQEIPAGYLDSIAIPDKAAGSASYVSALLNKYVKHAVAEPEKNFETVYAGIRKAPRRQRDYLTTLMIGYYAEQQLPDYKEQLTAAIDRAEGSIRDSAYLAYIERAKEFYNQRGMSFPDSVLQQTFLRTLDAEQKIAFSDVLTRHAGQPVFIDFWASWCCGCIMDIQQSQTTKKYLSDAGVACIYLSIDEDQAAWQESAASNKITENSYLSFDERKSPMARFFKIHSIPRYILLDKQHRIVSMNAPRPTPYDLKALKRLVESM